jgi:hypothetical protein
VKRRYTLHLLAIAIAILVGFAVWWFPSHRVKREPHLPESGRLSTTVRGILADRMRRHGQSLSELAVDVVVLDWKRVAALSSEIRQDASLARPVGQDATELNAQLPDRFFVLQDQLKLSAAELEKAAAAKNVDAMARAWGDMSSACVRCHATYLEPTH